ncbi:MAG: MATE family efflux transporter [Marinifilaceae bacterium]
MSGVRSSVRRGEILAIAYPIIFGNLAQTLIALTDTAFLGRVSAVALGASMMAGIYYFIYGTLAWGFAIGVQIIIARRLGEGKLERIGVIFHHGVLVVALLSAALFSILHFTTAPVLEAVIKSPNILAGALEYMHFRHWGIIFVCFNYLFRYFYIGLSTTKVITYSTIVMAVVNIALDYLLIFGHYGFPEMGIGGAALASVIAEVSALVFFIGYTLMFLPLKRYSMLAFHKFEGWLISAIFKLAFPTMLQKLFSFGTWFLFFMFVEHLGEIPIAVSGVIRSVYMLLGISVFAFGATANTLVSRLIGAGRQTEVLPTLRRITTLSFATIVPLVGGALLFPHEVLSIYTNDVALLTAGVPALYVLCAGVVSMVAAMIYFEAISGTGNTLQALIVEFFVLVAYTGAIWFFANYLQATVAVVWASEAVYGVTMTILSVLFMRLYPWGKKVI